MRTRRGSKAEAARRRWRGGGGEAEVVGEAEAARQSRRGGEMEAARLRRRGGGGEAEEAEEADEAEEGIGPAANTGAFRSWIDGTKEK